MKGKPRKRKKWK